MWKLIKESLVYNLLRRSLELWPYLKFSKIVFTKSEHRNQWQVSFPAYSFGGKKKYLLFFFTFDDEQTFYLSFDHGQGFTDENKQIVILNQSERVFPLSVGSEFYNFKISPFAPNQKFNVNVTKIIEVGFIPYFLLKIYKKLGPDYNLWPIKIKKALIFISKYGVKSFLQKFKGKNTVEYQAWIKKYDTLSAKDITLIKNHIKNLPLKPKISILLPTYKSNLDYLTQAIESVINQTYENWQLCIADDCSNQIELYELLQNYQKKEPRINVIFRSTNGHISECSNSALSLAIGDYVGFLDHDDLLSINCLYLNVAAINQNPNCQIIYSDEDKITHQNVRFDPYFKPDWNYQLFLQQNYLCHFTLISKSLINAVNGFRVGYEGSQDWDLFMRVTEKLDPKQIIHLPYVLYHWRAIAGSTAKEATFKPYALYSAQKVVTEHLERVNIPAKVTCDQAINQIFVQFCLTNLKQPKVTIIIPTKDNYELLKDCVTSIFNKTTYKNFDVIVVNNNSQQPETFEIFDLLQKEYKNLNIINDQQSFNFSRINNLAVNQADCELLAFVNNDIKVISPNWLEEMVNLSLLPKTGAVGAKLLYPNRNIQHAGVITGIGGVAAHVHKNLPEHEMGYFRRAILRQNLSAVTAACLVVGKDIFIDVGGFDEQNLAVAFNDVDLCLKIKQKGFNNIWTPFALLYHYESISRGHETSPKKYQRFQKEIDFMQNQWGKILENDPFYNPNLSIQYEDYSLAIPPRTVLPWRLNGNHQ